MGRPPPMLYAGYQRFLRSRLPGSRDRFAGLRERQAPTVCLLGCVDSRCNPAMVFDAEPGDILVVRNIANLVPSYREEGGCCCTSAALEFAVTKLGVQHLVVKGHSGCGGIQACIAAAAQAAPTTEFVDRWTTLARPALDEVRTTMPDLAGAELADAVGRCSVIGSLARLMSYPFVAEAVHAGRLELHGAWFAIGEADLSWLDREAGRFRPVAA